MDALASVLRRRRSLSPLHIIDLSSAGVYGDQQEVFCDADGFASLALRLP